MEKAVTEDANFENHAEPRLETQQRGEVEREDELCDRTDEVVEADEEDLEDCWRREDPDEVVEADEALVRGEAVPVGDAVPEHVHHGDVGEHDQERQRNREEQPRCDPRSSEGTLLARYEGFGGAGELEIVLAT